MSRKLGLLTIRVGNTLNICQPETRHIVEKQAKAAMMRGETVVWEDGREQWVIFNEIIDLTKSGSARWTWDRKGGKVKANVILRTRLPGTKNIVDEKIGTKFVIP